MSSLTRHKMILSLTVVYAIIWLAKQTSSETTCIKEAQCDRCDQYGLCKTECHDGYYGHRCTLPCSLTCRNRKCKLIKDRGIENCTDGCVPGFEGTSCRVEIICEEPGQTCYKCQRSCEGQFCKTNNRCVSGCIGSYYGRDCLSCTPNCDVCDRVSGTCFKCKPNWGGHLCQYPCTNCIGNCTNVGCVDGCKHGYFGLFCNKKCNNNCKEESDTQFPTVQPTITTVCDKLYGKCSHGCKDGWYGKYCSLKCPDECRNERCSEDGRCTDGCLSGYYGSGCLPCSETCLDNRCDVNRGVCYNGCRRGFYGMHCNVSCDGCSAGRCSQTDGRCLDGCKSSYYGERCDVYCKAGDSCALPPVNETVHSSVSGSTYLTSFNAIGLGILTLLSGFLFALVGQRMCRKRKPTGLTDKSTQQLKDPKMGNPDQEMSGNWYWEVNESNFGSSDQLNGEKQKPIKMTDFLESADQAYYLTLVSE